jgi:leucyl aminopeptidase
MHIDLYAWNDQSRPGRPEGGEAMAMRALFSLAKSGIPTHPRKDGDRLPSL